MKILQFLDHLIPYETFLNDLSSRIVRQLKADKEILNSSARGRLTNFLAAGM